jgi:hypothetical protein
MSALSSISGISSAPRPNVSSAAALRKQGPAPAAAIVKDSDGDHDGTKAGQVDARDFGKGLAIDRMA